MAILDDISQAVQIGKKKDVVALVEQAVSEGVAPDEILNVALIPAMDVVGDKFSKNEIFVPEMLVAARAMAAGTEILKPLLAQGGAEPLGKACIGTVKGDLHDIGKNLVRMMMEGKGIEIHDLGVDVPAEAFVDYIKEHEDLQLVCISALLTTTMPAMENTIKAIEEAGVRDRVKIMVGGAPITQEFADQIGADAYTGDAGSAAGKAAELLTA
ncbi:MAG: cobalamin-binding protein [Coriobacteriaceae bacterium]|nr:cobalamin-binding protein [Coriobacteriaceae bacterium]